MNENYSIVVVNDNTIQLKIISRYINKAGMTAHTFSSAEDALSYMQALNRPDLVITDLNMPEIDGWQFCSLIRSEEYAHLNDIPIIVTSATFKGIEAQESYKELGAYAFLPVPFRENSLLDAIRNVLSGEHQNIEASAVIFDDDEQFIDMAKAELERDSYQAIIVKDYDEARQHIKQNPPELLIINHTIISNDEYLDFIEEVRARDFITAILVITQERDPEKTKQCLKKGASAVIHKPVNARYFAQLCRVARRERSLMYIQDVLETRTRKLRDSEKRFRTLFEGIHDMVIVHDEKGTILDINEIGGDILDSSADEIRGIELRTLYYIEDYRRFLRETAKTRKEGFNQFELQIETITGQVMFVEIRQSVIEYQDKDAYLAVFHDITNRVTQERVRMQQERLSGVLEMAGAACHELNQPLQAVLGNIGLMMLDIDEDDPNYDTLEEIKNQAAKMADITKKLNRITRYEVKEYLSGTSIIDIDKASEEDN